jgi:hypothetical protein
VTGPPCGCGSGWGAPSARGTCPSCDPVGWVADAKVEIGPDDVCPDCGGWAKWCECLAKALRAEVEALAEARRRARIDAKLDALRSPPTHACIDCDAAISLAAMRCAEHAVEAKRATARAYNAAHPEERREAKRRARAKARATGLANATVSFGHGGPKPRPRNTH